MPAICADTTPPLTRDLATMTRSHGPRENATRRATRRPRAEPYVPLREEREWRVKHVLYFGALALYVLTIGQNWAHYTAAVLAHLWIRYDGRLDEVPLTIGAPLRAPRRPGT